MGTIAACALTGAVCFVFGIIFGKHVLSEAEAIKASVNSHVSAEVGRIRSEIVSGLRAAANKAST